MRVRNLAVGGFGLGYVGLRCVGFGCLLRNLRLLLRNRLGARYLRTFLIPAIGYRVSIGWKCLLGEVYGQRSSRVRMLQDPMCCGILQHRHLFLRPE